MGYRCTNCGFKSDAREFFRKEVVGRHGRMQWVCDACWAYQPTPAEETLILGTPVFTFNLSLLLIGHVVDDGFRLLAVLLVTVVAMISLPLRIIIHEAGHAFAAKAVGEEICMIVIGTGPLMRVVRFGGLAFRIHRYSRLGGRTSRFRLVGRSNRTQQALILAGGSLANLVCGGAAVTLAYLCLPADHSRLTLFVVAVLMGLGLPQFIMAIENLIPRRLQGGLASDGRQLLDLFKPIAVTDRDETEYHHVDILSHIDRREEATALVKDTMWTSPFKLSLAAQILDNISHTRGDRAAIEFYLEHEDRLQAAGDRDESVFQTLIWATTAWCAIKLGDPAYMPLADRLSSDALRETPDLHLCILTRAAWLIWIGENRAGLDLMVPAIRDVEPLIDKSELCAFIARGWGQSGDSRRAGLYRDLSQYLKHESHKLRP